MKLAIIGASGKTGTKLVRESLNRGYEVVAVCRDSSVTKLDEFLKNENFTIITAPVISDEKILIKALEGCDAVIAILISVRQMNATDLILSLENALNINEVYRVIFTAGEVTAIPQKGEELTFRQRFLLKLAPAIMKLTPFSMADMLNASAMIMQHDEWDWTIFRAPTLTEKHPVGYKFCNISEVTSTHKLSRKDYAACLIDSINTKEHYRKSMTVTSAV